MSGISIMNSLPELEECGRGNMLKCRFQNHIDQSPVIIFFVSVITIFYILPGLNKLLLFLFFEINWKCCMCCKRNKSKNDKKKSSKRAFKIFRSFKTFQKVTPSDSKLLSRESKTSKLVHKNTRKSRNSALLSAASQNSDNSGSKNSDEASPSDNNYENLMSEPKINKSKTEHKQGGGFFWRKSSKAVKSSKSMSHNKSGEKEKAPRTAVKRKLAPMDTNSLELSEAKQEDLSPASDSANSSNSSNSLEPAQKYTPMKDVDRQQEYAMAQGRINTEQSSSLRTLNEAFEENVL